MTTPKLSDERIEYLTKFTIEGPTAAELNDMLIEIIESRAKLAKVEELVAALEQLCNFCETLDYDEPDLQAWLSDARIALEKWRKS